MLLARAYRDFAWDEVWIAMNEIHHVIAHNESSVYVWWYLKRWYSMIGDGAFGTRNGEILPRGYGMAHFSRFLTDTVRVEAGFSALPIAIGGGRGHLGIGAPQVEVYDIISRGPQGVRALAGMRTSAPSAWQDGELKALEDMVSVVMFDDRTDAPGQSSDIRVALPPGFAATSAYGIVSDSAGRRHAPALVVLAQDGESAVVSLPSNAIVSLRFRGGDPVHGPGDPDPAGPSERKERVMLENGAYAIFRFDLPPGAVWGDFESIAAYSGWTRKTWQGRSATGGSWAATPRAILRF